MRRRRGNNEIELLPNDADLDGLPDSAVSQRFEDLSFSQYAVFWPTGRREQPRVAEARGRNTRGMAAARLDPATGVVRTIGMNGQIPESDLRGWLFVRAERQDRRGRGNTRAGTNVPYLCPSCETDSPQLLASEVFDLTGLPDQVDGQSRAP